MRTDREAQGKTEGPWERQGRSGEQRRLGGEGKGLRQRQRNTQGPSKDPTKLGILNNARQCPKHTYCCFTQICCGKQKGKSL